jgi:endonuclease/exonuclease/phosphatase family metal-dependent hydrolase
MLTRKHILIYLAITLVLIAGVFIGREVRTMSNYARADGPRFAGQFAPESSAFDGTLKVVTWNIRFAEDVETAVTELQTIPDLQDADMLLLQEMDERGVARLAQEMGYNYVYYPASVHSHHNRNFGNAILAKWPIVDDKKLLLPHENPSNEQRRNAVRGTVVVDGQDILVYTVHTETYWLPQGKRDEQAEAIVDDILSEPGQNWVIVGGDFNTITKADVAGLEAVFAQAGLERVSAEAGPSVEVAGVGIEADHLFARDVLPKDNGAFPETTASDHFPVWVDLYLGD